MLVPCERKPAILKMILKLHLSSAQPLLCSQAKFGIFLSSTGPKWKTRRRLLTPAFHYGILEDFAEVFQEQAAIFVEQLKVCFYVGQIGQSKSEHFALFSAY